MFFDDWNPLSDARFPALRRGGLDLSSWRPGLPWRLFGEESWPKIDAYQKGEDLVVKAEIPGVQPEDIEVALEEGHLTISGKTEREEKVEDEDYFRMERTVGSFSRSIDVPSDVKESDIEAKYSDGILEIVVKGAAKLASKARKSIPVKASERKPKELKASKSTKKKASKKSGK
ncbi:MAG: Hsp20/alpha crystallin family protein [Actinomycetota bacterium]|nr:Hsp20/alpha crystallin family protein [Actinomycetota bacterium]